jgi:hypothetical protein
MMAEFFATYYPRRRDVKKIIEKGAVSKETAKTCEELGMSKSTLEYLVFVKDIKKTEDGRFYVPCEEEK